MRLLYIQNEFLNRCIRFVSKMIVRFIFKYSVQGKDPSLLSRSGIIIANHVSFIDPVLIAASVKGPVTFFMSSDELDESKHALLLKHIGVIGVNFIDPIHREASMVKIQNELAKNRWVILFPEGFISRSGFMNAFDSRIIQLMQHADTTLYPLYIDYRASRAKQQETPCESFEPSLRKTVRILWGEKIGSPITSQTCKQAIQDLSVESFQSRIRKHRNLGYLFVKRARKHWNKPLLSESTGKQFTYGKALTGSLLIADTISKGQSNEPIIGVLLPSCTAGALVNSAITLAGKTVVNLNFTAGEESITKAVSSCAIKTVITSRQFMKKIGSVPIHGNVIYIEDLIAGFKKRDQLFALVKALFLPLFLFHTLKKIDSQSTATIIFSSGSTADPKGVVLTHHNIISNIEQMHTVLELNHQDCMIASLPLFHSFGYTVTTWFPFLAAFRVVYHSNPLDASTIVSMIRDEKATILVSTPSFLNSYKRKASIADLRTLKYVIAGAEKLNQQLRHDYKTNFGITLLEGYGATELSPVTFLNVPDMFMWGRVEPGNRAGTIGRLLPGMSMRVLNPESGVPCRIGQEGMLFVKGPNVMKEYYNQKEKTELVLNDGWYCTNDIVTVLPGGFVRLVDRLSRFSKIAGEMVPHGAIEEILMNEVKSDERSIVVTSVPDEVRGERLVVLYTSEAPDEEQLMSIIEKANIPNLWKPDRNALVKVESIPQMGTGKIDMKKIKATAIESIRLSQQQCITVK